MDDEWNEETRTQSQGLGQRLRDTNRNSVMGTETEMGTETVTEGHVQWKRESDFTDRLVPLCSILEYDQMYTHTYL